MAAIRHRSTRKLVVAGLMLAALPLQAKAITGHNLFALSGLNGGPSGGADGGEVVSDSMIFNAANPSGLSIAPVGTVDTAVRGTDGTDQVGSISRGGVSQASLWSGSAASWVSLHSGA